MSSQVNNRPAFMASRTIATANESTTLKSNWVRKLSNDRKKNQIKQTTVNVNDVGNRAKWNESLEP